MAVEVGHVKVIATPCGTEEIVFWVVTKDPGKNAKFTAWSDSPRRVPPATDDLGNKYPAAVAYLPYTDIRHRPDGILDERIVRPDLVALRKMIPRGRINGSGQITSEFACGDMLAYPPLVPAAKKMIVELPAANVGGTGMIRFEFDVAKVREMHAKPYYPPEFYPPDLTKP